MGCYSNSQDLRRLRQQRKINRARLANYKDLYLAARAARDYLKDVLPANNEALVAQLNAALVDPHQVQQEKQNGYK